MTRTRYAVAPWLDGAPRRARPVHAALAQKLEVPIAIVGGGLTGAATAYACAAAGLHVALLEADRIGHGASGRGTGLILQAPHVGFPDMEALHGRRTAKVVWAAWRRAALDLSATVRRLNIRTGLTAADALTWARAADVKRLEREHAARRAARFEGTWLTGRALSRMRIHAAAGLRTRGDAIVDPLRLCQGFARAAAARGAAIYERTRVTAVSQLNRHVDIECTRGRVRCDTVIIATGDPGDLFEPLARHVSACESYVVQTPPLPAAVRAAAPDRTLILQDCGQPSHRLAWMAGDRILWTGADQPRTPERTRQQTLVQRTGQLMYELSLVLPEISGIQPEYGWDAPYSVGRDGLPLVGPHRNYPRHLFALGLGANPAAAFLASRLLLRHATDSLDKADAAFGFIRLSR